MRNVCWFSCGAASTVAAKIVLDEQQHTVVAYTDPGAEHEDNKRYLADVAKWLGVEILVLRSEKYADIWDVFEKTRFLVGPYGARCTMELKKKVREKFSEYDDVHIFGFCKGEEHRHDRFGAQNRGVDYRSPLLEQGITKEDCFKVISDAGIELPAMYRMGYPNNNCVGCVKGQKKYWNRIRTTHPEVFARMAKVERELNAAINKTYAGGKRQRVFLDELPPDAGRYEAEPSISCGAVCEVDFSQHEEQNP